MSMNRGEKALYNSLANALSQIVTMICGFILPRLILSRFGSSYNGITASISQFLSVVSLLSAGIGGVTRAALYKSLAVNDIARTSAIILATERYMRKVAMIFLGIIFGFALVYPRFVESEFEHWFSSSLVVIISLSTFIQYFFGNAYYGLFQADQRQYVISLLNIISVIINTIIAAILIKIGIGIHGVKLGSAIAYSIMPISLNILANRQYRLDRNVKPDYSSINQRWDAFFHQIAAFIHNNTDITLLTLFTNTKEISVYSVYYLVANGLKSLMSSFIVGVESAFGNLIAMNESEALKRNVAHYEIILHVLSSVLFGAAIILVTPFVQVYTSGVTDVNYTRYIFGYLAIIGEILFVLRSPYEALVNAAGHFKQTKKYAFMEAGINLVISVFMVRRFGLIGVVIGTVVAIAFRNIAYGVYSSKVILNRRFNVFVKRFIVTGITIILIYALSKILPKPEMISYLNWIVYSIEVTLLSITVTVFLNYALYKNDLIQMLKKVFGILARTVRKYA